MAPSALGYGDGRQTWFDRTATVLFAVAVGFSGFGLQQWHLESSRKRVLGAILRNELGIIIEQTENAQIETYRDEPNRLRQTISGLGAPAIRAVRDSGLFLEYGTKLASIEELGRSVVAARERVFTEMGKQTGQSTKVTAVELLLKTKALHYLACNLLGELEAIPPYKAHEGCAVNEG